MKQELFPEIADSGLRIDKYLSTVNEQLSRSYIQKLLKSGLVLVCLLYTSDAADD